MSWLRKLFTPVDRGAPTVVYTCKRCGGLTASEYRDKHENLCPGRGRA